MKSTSSPVLIGFEESQAITTRLRAKGIEAYSCYLQPMVLKQINGDPNFLQTKINIMRTLYLAKYSFCEISEVKISSETTAFVTRADNGEREKRFSDYAGFYETREEAKRAILNRLFSKKRMLFEQIKGVEREIEKASAL